jgi:hypothetical protein
METSTIIYSLKSGTNATVLYTFANKDVVILDADGQTSNVLLRATEKTSKIVSLVLYNVVTNDTVVMALPSNVYGQKGVLFAQYWESQGAYVALFQPDGPQNQYLTCLINPKTLSIKTLTRITGPVGYELLFSLTPFVALNPWRGTLASLNFLSQQLASFALRNGELVNNVTVPVPRLSSPSGLFPDEVKSRLIALFEPEYVGNPLNLTTIDPLTGNITVVKSFHLELGEFFIYADRFSVASREIYLHLQDFDFRPAYGVVNIDSGEYSPLHFNNYYGYAPIFVPIV